MKGNIKLEAKVDGLGEIYQARLPFDEALNSLRINGVSPLSAKDLAYAIMQEPRFSSVSTIGSYIKEGIISLPNKKDNIILVKNSPILKNSKDATKAYRELEYFHIPKELAFNYLEDARNIKNNSSILVKCDNSVAFRNGYKLIPTNRFNEDEMTLWLFEDIAQTYGLFLKEVKGINEIELKFYRFHYSDLKEPISNQLFFKPIEKEEYSYGRPGFNGDFRQYNFGFIRGLLRKNKIINKRVGMRTPREIKSALKKVGISNQLEQIIFKNLNL